jgi:hypothetical protein
MTHRSRSLGRQSAKRAGPAERLGHRIQGWCSEETVRSFLAVSLEQGGRTALLRVAPFYALARSGADYRPTCSFQRLYPRASRRCLWPAIRQRARARPVLRLVLQGLPAKKTGAVEAVSPIHNTAITDAGAGRTRANCWERLRNLRTTVGRRHNPSPRPLVTPKDRLAKRRWGYGGRRAASE